MKVITENEIIVTRSAAGEPIWSAAEGKLVKKAKGLVGSGKIAGLVDSVKSFKNTPPIQTPAPLPPPAPEKKGLSTGAKWGIGIGVAAILGLAIWYVKKQK